MCWSGKRNKISLEETSVYTYETDLLLELSLNCELRIGKKQTGGERCEFTKVSTNPNRVK